MRIEFINEKKTEWLLDGGEILKLNDVISSQYYENESIILYLIGRNSRNPDYLIGYRIDGKKVFKVPSPKGFSFEYLTKHPKAPMAVVCGVLDIENSNELWSDFFFSIDAETGKLEKLCVAR